MAAAAKRLHVSIIGASGLKHMNFSGDAPYCVCEVKHAKGNRGKSGKIETKPIPNTLDPTWNEQGELDFEVGDELKFVIYDKGMIGSKTEGTAMLPGSYIMPHGFEGDVPIEGLHEAMLHVRIVPLDAPGASVAPAAAAAAPPAHAAAAAPPAYHAPATTVSQDVAAANGIPPQRLEVTVMMAKGLKHMNMTGDKPYCVCEVRHTNKHATACKFETKQIPGTLDPVWDEVGYIDPVEAGDSLDFTIYDKGTIGSKTEGKATLQWKHFYPNGCEAELPIAGLQNAVLHVRVVPQGPSRPGEPLPPPAPAHTQTAAAATPATAPTAPEKKAAPPIHAQGPARKLQVTIIQANGLKHLNMSGDNMYCDCEVKHADKKSKAAKCETAQVKGLEPVWNETHELEPWHMGEPIEFTIYDKGLLNSKLEGKALLPSEYFEQSGFEGDVPIEGLHDAMVHVRVIPGAVLSEAPPAHAAHTAQQAPAHAAQQPPPATYAAPAPPASVPASAAPAAQKLQVSVYEAVGLKHLNMTGDNMYCECRVLPTEKGAAQSKFSTKKIAKTLEPNWNETHEVDGWHEGESLEFVVYDAGMIGSKLEGKALLASNYFYPNGFDGDVPIEGLHNAMLHVRVLPAGPATAATHAGAAHMPAAQTATHTAAHTAAAQAPTYQHQQQKDGAEVGPPQKLQVTIIQALGLKHLNMSGDNMYCECQVKHNDKKSAVAKCTTKQIPKSLEPAWNETHELEPWHVGESLEFTVYDKGMISSKLEGKAVLQSQYFHPNGFEGDVPIDGLRDAVVHVRVLPMGPMGAVAAKAPEQAALHSPQKPAAQTPPHQQTTAPPPPPGGGQMQKLKVDIIQAIGLKHLNMSGDNMYCECVVKHTDTKAKAAKCSTKQVANSLEPVWNESFELDPWNMGDGLEFTIYDKGLIGSKTEGKALLGAEYFYPNGFEGDVPIEGLHNAMLHVRVLPAGPSADTFAPSQHHAPVQATGPPQKLQVTVLEAVGMKHLNMTGDNIYCECKVQHADKKATPAKFTTKQIKSLEPNWNETHELDPWSAGEPLEFVLYDKGAIGSKTEGKALLPSEYFWPIGFDGDVPIEGLRDAMLHVRVLPAGPSGASGQASVATAAAAPTPPIHAEGPLRKLSLNIFSATGLKHLNMTGDNMYCECSVKHADKKAKPAKCTTKTVAKSLEPTWNEQHELDPWQVGEPLEFVVYDKGVIGSKTEGKAHLASEYFWPNGFEGDVPIEGLPNATIYVKVLPAGSSAHTFETTVSHGEITTHGPARKLQVSVFEAQGLKHLNMTGDNMYCTCEVEHADKKAKPASFQTKTIAKTLEPNWNEVHEMDPWHAGEPLKFVIYDKGAIGSKVEGTALLPSNYFEANGFDGDVPIEGLQEAMLHVKVLPGALSSSAPVQGGNAAAVQANAAAQALNAAHNQVAANSAPQTVAQAASHPQKLQVWIHEAVGLKHLNMTGDNMYVVCKVQANNKKAKLATCQTKTIAKTLEPNWNEVHELDPWEAGDAIEFTIYDKGMVGSKVEGKGLLPSEYFWPNGFDGDVPIEGLKDAMLHVKVFPAGVSSSTFAPTAAAKRPSVKAEGPKQRLEVSIVQAFGLKHLNVSGDNMYCECKVLHADHNQAASCCETKQVANSLDPIWNETHELDPWRIGEPLEFAIYDKGMIGSKTEGKAVLPSDFFYPKGFEGDVPLEGVPDAKVHVIIVPKGLSAQEEQRPPSQGTGATLRTAAASGSRVLDVSTNHGFGVGQAVRVNPGGATQEDCLVAGFGSLVLQHPLRCTHRAGEQVIPLSPLPAGSAQGKPLNVTPTQGPQKLKVSIIRATALEHLNLAGDAPYCICTVPRTDKSAKHSSCQTKAIRGTLDPEWNETYDIDPWTPGEPLEFAVYDRGMIGSKQEGKAIRLPSESFYPQGFEGDLSIQGIPNAKLHVRVVPSGLATSLDSSMLPAGQGQKLHVSIVKAKGLKHMNMVGDSPYCFCEVKHADKKAKATTCQTKPVSGSLDPVWNESYDLDPWHPGEPLEFTVYDKGVVGSKTEGKATLMSSQFHPTGFDGELPVEGLPGASLHVRIAPTNIVGTVPGAATPTAGPWAPGTGVVMDHHGMPTSYPKPMPGAYYAPTATHVVHAPASLPTAVITSPSRTRPQVYAPPMAAQDLFNALDTNHDGVISREEFNALQAHKQPVMAEPVAYPAQPAQYYHAPAPTAVPASASLRPGRLVPGSPTWPQAAAPVNMRPPMMPSAQALPTWPSRSYVPRATTTYAAVQSAPYVSPYGAHASQSYVPPQTPSYVPAPVPARAADLFAQLDRNHDGMLSREEFAALHAGMASPPMPMGGGCPYVSPVVAATSRSFVPPQVVSHPVADRRY